MCAPNRRLERRLDVVNTVLSRIQNNNGANKDVQIIDLSYFEAEEKYMEGTGCLIFDHLKKIIYCCVSIRSNTTILKKIAELLQYSFILFHANDSNNYPIYHTNVMLTIASKYIIICEDAISDLPGVGTDTESYVMADISSKKDVMASFTTCMSTNEGGTIPVSRDIITISLEQVGQFAGNMLEVYDKNGQSYLCMSETARNCLTPNQIEKIMKYSEIIALPIPTIERYGGGSVRCMMCEVQY